VGWGRVVAVVELRDPVLPRPLGANRQPPCAHVCYCVRVAPPDSALRNSLATPDPGCYSFLDISRPGRAARPSLSVGPRTFPQYNALRVPGADSGPRSIHERCDDVVAEPLPLQDDPPVALPQGESPSPGGGARGAVGLPVDQRWSMMIPDIQFNGERALVGSRVVGEIHPPLMRKGTFLYINTLTGERGHARTREEACEALRSSIIATYERIARVKERPSSNPADAAGGAGTEVDRRARLPYLAKADDAPPLMMFGNRQPLRPSRPASVGQHWKGTPGGKKSTKGRKARTPTKTQVSYPLVRCRYCQAHVRKDRLRRHVARQHADRLPRR